MMRSIVVATGAALLTGLGPTTNAAAQQRVYVETGRFDLPGGVFDVGADGRLIGLQGSDIVRQDAINGSTYTTIGSIDPAFASPFGASFLAISPDGQRVAIGDNTFGAPGDAFVGVFDLSGAEIARVAAANFAGAWADDNTLFVTGGDFVNSSLVTRVDVAGQSSSVVIDDFAGFSGGLAIDGSTLVTANGFATGGPGDSQTGEVRSFDLADLTGTGTLSFENDGTTVATALSGGSLDYDAEGNLIVGGQTDGVGGRIAVIASDGTRSDIESPFGTDFTLARFNDTTGDVLVFDGSGVAVRFALIPAPSTAAVFVGCLVARSRRRDG